MFNLQNDAKSIYDINNYTESSNNVEIQHKNDIHLNPNLKINNERPMQIKSNNQKIKIETEEEFTLDNFIEVDMENIEDLEVNDFIRYKNKTDNKIKRGGYLIKIYKKILKDNTEKMYLQLAFNKYISKGSKIGSYSVSFANIEKLYKKVANTIEHNLISNSINGISNTIDNNIQNIFNELSLKNNEIKILKEDIELLKKENIKTTERMKKIVEYIKELSNNIKR